MSSSSGAPDNDELNVILDKQPDKGSKVGHVSECLSAGSLKLFRELLQSHQLLQPLIYAEPKVLANQADVNVFLVCFD
jgi:hypothetical protein